jgi:hypothetical protein
MHIVRVAEASKNRSHVGTFEAWLRKEIAAANLGTTSKA